MDNTSKTKLNPPEGIERKRLIFWNTRQKIIPERPEDPSKYPEEDERHWFDMEYAGWEIKKKNIPESPRDGPNGKYIICLVPGEHPYINTYIKSMTYIADSFDIRIRILNAGWNTAVQGLQVDQAIEEKPDMIILLPENIKESTRLYKKINESRIPVMASNFLPALESYPYFLAWSGPDDWGQFRMLSRKFAELMNYRGGYCIVRHVTNTSSYYARTYSVITELLKIAPEIKLLDMESTNLNKEITKMTVLKWIKKYGEELKGIVCADDNYPMAGVVEALEKTRRNDIICVAAGNTEVGMDLLRKGKIHAITYQSPEIDGSLSIQLTVDWFNGLDIEPITYLPLRIITKNDVDDFFKKKNGIHKINMERLRQLITEKKENMIEPFFDEIYYMFYNAEIVTIEYFRGVAIELMASLINLIKIYKLDMDEILGSYEYLYKNLFKQKTVKNTLNWMQLMCIKIIEHLRVDRKNHKSFIINIIQYVNNNFSKQISLKTLSHKYNISAAYLGQQFRKEMGKGFSQYLNEMRIEKAKKLLINTSLRANEIATEVGYRNADYFYNIFKKYTGVYPSYFKR